MLHAFPASWIYCPGPAGGALRRIHFPSGDPYVKNASLRTPFSATALALGMLAAAPSFAADTKSVAVTAIVEHPALDAVRDGVKAELKASGYEEGKNLKFTYQSAQGNVGTAAQIARKYVGDAPDVIVAIATPSAQAVVASTKTIPVVYSAITDPVAAKLVKNWEASGTNVTGVSDLSPLESMLASSSRWCRTPSASA